MDTRRIGSPPAAALGPKNGPSNCDCSLTQNRLLLRSEGFNFSTRVPSCQRLKSSLECFVMTTVVLTAHFDGEKVQFDEPCRLDANARLMVVVLPPDDERHAWSRLSAGQLARAYGDTEPEYTAADLRP